MQHPSFKMLTQESSFTAPSEQRFKFHEVSLGIKGMRYKAELTSATHGRTKSILDEDDPRGGFGGETGGGMAEENFPQPPITLYLFPLETYTQTRCRPKAQSLPSRGCHETRHIKGS